MDNEQQWTIVVDIRGYEEYQHFIFETFKRITAQHPHHSFVFIFDKPFDPSIIFSKNITAVVVKPQKISLLNDLTISSLLKIYKADVFITAKFLSQTKVKQCLIAFDKLAGKFLAKANEIIADSEFSKKEIIEKCKTDPGKVGVVYKGVDEIFQPLTFQQKESIKEKYSSGNEYFSLMLSFSP